MAALAAGDTAKEDTEVGAPQQLTMKIPMQARREGMVDVKFVARGSGEVQGRAEVTRCDGWYLQFKKMCQICLSAVALHCYCSHLILATSQHRPLIPLVRRNACRSIHLQLARRVSDFSKLITRVAWFNTVRVCALNLRRNACQRWHG